MTSRPSAFLVALLSCCPLGCGGETNLPVDAAPPAVTLTSPESNAASVATNAHVSVAFSEAMDPSSITDGSFNLIGVAGTVSVSGAAATFTPGASLLPDTSYTAVVTAAATDLAGNPLPADYAWTFTTGSAPDTTAPTVQLTAPANEETGVSLSVGVRVAFSEVMDLSSLNASTFTVGGVSGAVTASATTATFTPAAPLAFSTLYDATLSAGVKDLAGNALAAPFSWSFTTRADSCEPELHCAAPSSNEICISGRVAFGADRAHVIDAATAQDIEVRLYDALAFAGDPAATPPIRALTVQSEELDTCGRFSARFNTSSTPNGSIAVVTAGRVGSAAQDSYVLGTVTRPVTSGVNLTGVRAYLVSRAQDEAWSTDAGLSGTTFATGGTCAVRFRQGGAATDAIPGTPIAGVVPTWNGTSDPSKDHFFSDTEPTTLHTVDGSLDATGANGTSFLLVGTGFGDLGAGSSCTKPAGGAGTLTVLGSELGAATGGAIFFFNVEVSCQ